MWAPTKQIRSNDGSFDSYKKLYFRFMEIERREVGRKRKSKNWFFQRPVEKLSNYHLRTVLSELLMNWFGRMMAHFISDPLCFWFAGDARWRNKRKVKIRQWWRLLSDNSYDILNSTAGWFCRVRSLSFSLKYFRSVHFASQVQKLSGVKKYDEKGKYLEEFFCYFPFFLLPSGRIPNFSPWKFSNSLRLRSVVLFVGIRFSYLVRV